MYPSGTPSRNTTKSGAPQAICDGSLTARTPSSPIPSPIPSTSACSAGAVAVLGRITCSQRLGYCPPIGAKYPNPLNCYASSNHNHSQVFRQLQTERISHSPTYNQRGDRNAESFLLRCCSFLRGWRCHLNNA